MRFVMLMIPKGYGSAEPGTMRLHCTQLAGHRPVSGTGVPQLAQGNAYGSP